MGNDSNEIVNKDLILREKLAIERTNMAIDRTLLAFLRTALYFAIAGMTVTSLLKIHHGWWIEITFWIIAGLLLIVGFVNFFRQKKRLGTNNIHLGNYKMDWDDD